MKNITKQEAVRMLFAENKDVVVHMQESVDSDSDKDYDAELVGVINEYRKGFEVCVEIGEGLFWLPINRVFVKDGTDIPCCMKPGCDNCSNRMDAPYDDHCTEYGAESLENIKTAKLSNGCHKWRPFLLYGTKEESPRPASYCPACNGIGKVPGDLSRSSELDETCQFCAGGGLV